MAPLALSDRSPSAQEVNDTPFGNNMAYRTDIFAKYGDFRIDLRPRPSTRVPQKGEDIEFGPRLLTAGEQPGYEPSAIVY
jgi:hypothetical protein